LATTVSPRPSEDTSPPAPEPPARSPSASQLAAIAPAAGPTAPSDTTDGGDVETDSLESSIAGSLDKGPAPDDEAQAPTSGDQPVLGGGLLFQARPRARAVGGQGTASNGRNGSSAEQDVSGWGNESFWQ
jgi:hypothetical protein